MGGKKPEEQSNFRKVVGYFLGHEKPKDKLAPRPKKRPAKAAKKPSTKPKKRA